MDERETIFTYSRAQAMADGVLVDVSEAARAVGIKYPVAVTDTLYHQFVEVPEILKSEGQTTEGRLHDLLSMLVFAIRKERGSNDSIHFQVAFQSSKRRMEDARVWASVGGGDDGDPVITIMLEGED